MLRFLLYPNSPLHPPPSKTLLTYFPAGPYLEGVLFLWGSYNPPRRSSVPKNLIFYVLMSHLSKVIFLMYFLFIIQLFDVDILIRMLFCLIK